MFKTRLLSGIVLVAVMFGLFFAGGDILLGAMCIISWIGMFELYRIFHVEKHPAGFLGYIAAFAYYASLRFALPMESLFIPTALLLALLVVFVMKYPDLKSDQMMAVFFGFFYVALMLSCIYRTRMLVHGEYLVWLILLCSWGSDTCAYCVGVLFGKHKMSPVLSPKKSVEGAVGGVVGAMLLTVIYAMVFHEGLQIPPERIWVLAPIAGAGALISMVGDLAASAFKRFYDIKDYGTLIPGHGGILDRFDSVIITAPIIYYLCFHFL